MTKIMNEIYYMVEDQAGQELMRDKEAKSLEEKRNALWDEVIHRLGEDGQEIQEVIKRLDLELETIHDKALFRAALSLGAELTRPEAGAKATAALS